MPAAAASRRTQAERSATTQARLLDAALVCLIEHGYGGTTTTVVAECAGVSRGAQLHHYPTRAALVAAAVQHLYERLTVAYQDGFAQLPRRGRLRAAIDLLWSMFADPRYAAVLELFTAARTDAELRAQLQPIAERHEANVAHLARQYFPTAAAQPDFDITLRLVLDAMQGMASARGVHDYGPSESARLAALHALAARVFTPAGNLEET